MPALLVHSLATSRLFSDAPVPACVFVSAIASPHRGSMQVVRAQAQSMQFCLCWLLAIEPGQISSKLVTFSC